MIYFIQAGLNGPVKIGHTNIEVRKRFNGLQIGNHEQLYLLRLENGYLDREEYLHRMFFSTLVRGEWYRNGDHLMNYIYNGVEPHLDKNGHCIPSDDQVCIGYKVGAIHWRNNRWNRCDMSTGKVDFDMDFQGPEKALGIEPLPIEPPSPMRRRRRMQDDQDNGRYLL